VFAYWKYVQGIRGFKRYRIDALCLKVVFNRIFKEKESCAVAFDKPLCARRFMDWLADKTVPSDYFSHLDFSTLVEELAFLLRGDNLLAN